MSEIISSQKELSEREKFMELYKESHIPENEILYNLGLYVNRQLLSRFLFLHEIYQQILNVHGVIMECGVRYGQGMALYANLRGILEPHNYNRKIIGFDTFTGFKSVNEKDGDYMDGYMSVGDGYERHLEQILHYHEQESPISQIKKFELVKGDACQTVPNYFKQHPETIVALAYMDYDIYSPTKTTLEALKRHLIKGSIIAFDELNHPDYPGETLAAQEVLGLENYKLIHSRYSPTASYIVFE